MKLNTLTLGLGLALTSVALGGNDGGGTDRDRQDRFEGDLVDAAVANDFSTLVTLVQAAGLEDALRSADGLTVFAPTNDAFAALPSVPENLTDVLLYHVVAATVASGDLFDGQVVATAYAGHSFTVNIDGSVTITDEAGNTTTVTVTDVAASNGLIHVVDAVLIPTP